MEKRVISTELFEEENRTENSLRPKLLSDYIGQAKAKEKLKIYIEKDIFLVDDGQILGHFT